MTPVKFVQEMDGLKDLVDGMPIPPEKRAFVSSAINRLVERAGEVDKLTFVSTINMIESEVGWPRIGQGDLTRSYGVLRDFTT